VRGLSDESRRAILEKVKAKLGFSEALKALKISRGSLHNYFHGLRRVPDEVVSRALRYLEEEEFNEVVRGVDRLRATGLVREDGSIDYPLILQAVALATHDEYLKQAILRFCVENFREDLKKMLGVLPSTVKLTWEKSFEEFLTMRKKRRKVLDPETIAYYRNLFKKHLEGKAFEVTREDVERALEGLKPKPLRGRAKYYIEHKGKRYPIKQVVEAVTGLSRLDFTAALALRVLRELGFEVRELGKEMVELHVRKTIPEEPTYYSQMLAKRLGKATPEEAIREVLENPDKYPEDAKRILVITEEHVYDGHELIESIRPYFLHGKVNFFKLEEVREGPRVKTKMAIVPEEPYAVVALERSRHESEFRRELVSVYVFAKDSWRAMRLA